MAQSASDFTRAYSKFLAHVWTDPAFKTEVHADPVKALKSAGVYLKPGATVTIKQPTGKPFLAAQIDQWQEGNTSGHYDIVVPPTAPAPLKQEKLGAITADDSYCCCSCPSCSCT